VDKNPSSLYRRVVGNLAAGDVIVVGRGCLEIDVLGIAAFSAHLFLLAAHNSQSLSAYDRRGKIRDAAIRRIDMPPKTEGILESALYIADKARSVQFYERIFGLRVISDFEDRGCAMQAGSRHVLHLFKKGGPAYD
jgi:hypothetical protein